MDVIGNWHMHFGSTPYDAHTTCAKLRSLFLLYHELFYDHELFTDHELCDARTLKNFTTLPDAALLLHPCDARTLCGELRLLFFYCTVNSFLTMNSLPTVNSVTHALRLRPMWRTHYVWRAPLALFLLHRELFSDRELFTNCELHDSRTNIVFHTYISFTHLYITTIF